MAKVTIYTTSTCRYCKAAKEYLDSIGVDYNNIDVGKNHEKGKEMIKLSGQAGVPVIVIGKKIIVGFDQDEIDDALKKS